ncbi:unnamed protein product, partial [Brassica napus]
GPKAHPQKPDDKVGEPVKKARHTDRSALFTRYASPSPRLNHLRRYAVGAIPAKNCVCRSLETDKPPNEPVTVLHRTVFTPASSIDHRDLHRL